MESVIRIRPYKDPITKIVFGKLGYKVVYPWIVYNAMLILTSVYYGTLTEIHLSFESPVAPVTVPLFEDKSFYVYFILGILGIIIVNQVMKTIPSMFIGLWENKILRSKNKRKIPVEEYNKQLREVEKKINSKKSYIYAAAYILIAFGSSFIDSYRIPVTEASVILYYDFRLFPLSGILIYITYGFIYFLVVVILYKIVLLIHFLRKLHKTFDFQVRPLHPDKCGGLKPVGDFCVNVDYIIFILFIVIVTFQTSPHDEGLNLSLYFFLPSYIIFATFSFFYPLLPIHNSMKAQKDDFLGRLNEKLDPAYKEMLDEIMDEAKKESLKISKRVGCTDRIYETADIMREWPFNISFR